MTRGVYTQSSQVKLAVATLILVIMMLSAMAARARASGILFTPQQIAAMSEARTVGAQYGFPQLLIAIIWHESSFCSQLVGDDDRSFGCGQVQLHTAEFISGHPVSRYDLIHDRTLNLNIAARYLQYCLVRFGFERGIYCYNHGAPRAAAATTRMVETNQYVARVLTLFGNVEDLLAIPGHLTGLRNQVGPRRFAHVPDGFLYAQADSDFLPHVFRSRQRLAACRANGGFQWLSG